MIFAKGEYHLQWVLPKVLHSLPAVPASDEPKRAIPYRQHLRHVGLFQEAAAQYDLRARIAGARQGFHLSGMKFFSCKTLYATSWEAVQGAYSAAIYPVIGTDRIDKGQVRKQGARGGEPHSILACSAVFAHSDEPATIRMLSVSKMDQRGTLCV